MVNGDGRFASGGVGEGSNSPQGIFSLPNQWFKMMGNGCWPSMCRDASRRCWVFDGRHRNVFIFAPDFGSVEEWVRVTDNQRGDYWPDAWVQPKPGE